MNSVVALAIDENNIYVPCANLPKCNNSRKFNLHANDTRSLANREEGRGTNCACAYDSVVIDHTTMRATLVQRTKYTDIFERRRRF